MHLFTHTYVRFYIEAHLIQVLEAQIASAFELIDFEFYQLHQRAQHMRVVPDLLSYLRALLAPSESNAKGLAITRGKGITKIGRGGSSVLAIGAQEQLLPDKLGSKAIKGNGTQKQSVEGDRNVSQHQNGNGNGGGIGDARDFDEIAGDIGRDVDVDLQDEGEEENGVDQGKVSKNAGYLGWESSVFDF
jgi:hypothetical protein